MSVISDLSGNSQSLFCKRLFRDQGTEGPGHSSPPSHSNSSRSLLRALLRAGAGSGPATALATEMGQVCQGMFEAMADIPERKTRASHYLI